ncbi:putative DNA binding domain-containing protein [Myxococcota bacterium]|nr:putative DNA binding domain-containing protein [Myxococcota bacterium]
MSAVEALEAIRAILDGARAADLESGTLEFKQQGRSFDDTVKEVVQATLCFANANGGTVVVGVADKLSGPAAFLGTSLDPADLQRRIYDLSRPPLLADVRRETVGAVALLLVVVPRSPEIHSDSQGRAPRRVGRDCIPLDPLDQARLREERRGVDWSAQPSSRPAADVAPAAITAARHRLERLRDERQRLARLSAPDLLRALRVVTPEGMLLRAGEVLFCPQDEGDASAVVYQFRLTPAGEPRAVERPRHPLVLAFDRVLELVQARRNATPVNLPDGQQIHVEDFPGLAVREALVNALVHRDYHLGGPVHVEHSPEVFVVASPGPLVGGVTPDNILTHPSTPRNPLLASAARVLGLAEEVGRGVDRMYREMIQSGRDLPRIESSAAQVRVTFVGGAPNAQIARFAAQLPAQEREDTDTMLVLFKLCSVRLLDAQRLAPFIQKTVDEAESVLRRLSGDAVGMLEPTRQTARRAHPAYRLRAQVLRALGSAVPYQRRTVDEIDRKVIAHVVEYGRITNKTVQNLLDVSLQRARDLLSDWVRRGILVKTSAHERGPGVEYGPGPGFPGSGGRKRRTDSRGDHGSTLPLPFPPGGAESEASTRASPSRTRSPRGRLRSTPGSVAAPDGAAEVSDRGDAAAEPDEADPVRESSC